MDGGGPGFRFSVVGFVLLSLGVAWLLDVAGYIEFRWDIVGPLVLIALGLSLLLRPRGGQGWAQWHVQRGPPPPRP